jgi:hypothetical protein
MKYVSPEYQAQLDKLAETLCTPERYGKVAQDLGQLVLFSSDMGNTTIAVELADRLDDELRA